MAVAGHLSSLKKWMPNPHKNRFAILIPSYNEDNIIVETAFEAARHNYPSSHFDVFIAADHLSNETVEKLSALRVQVMRVEFELGSKAKSLNYLLNHIIEKNYDASIILDGDNIMLDGCLEKVNAAFQEGSAAVQCHRIAKNLNTPIAILDAISEEINNHLFRRGQRALCFSASTIGSGMAFHFNKLKQVYNKPGILGNPACDREVDFEMMKDRIVVEYIDDAYVLDEKVSGHAVFQRQRTRWLESQLIHLKLFFSSKEYVPNKSKDYWNKLFINLMPPRMILLASFFIVALVCLLEYLTDIPITGIAGFYWFTIFILYIFCLMISIPAKMYNRRTAAAVLYLPSAILSFLKAAMGIKTNRKEFVHTPKTFGQNTDSSKD